MTSFRNLLLASALLGACTTSTGDDGAPRGPIGKADILGTCTADSCGGPSDDGNCWCDDLCVTFGDCCANHADVCEAPTRTCGGFAGLTCGADEYCHYDADQSCGNADQSGVCLPKPFVCNKAIIQVCGCDGTTYNNECEAHAAGVSVAHATACEMPQPQQCGGFAGSTCPSGQFCDYAAGEMCGAADQLGTCKPEPEACAEILAPVCGCDGNTYGNSCEANAAGTAVSHDGVCAICGGFGNLQCASGTTCVENDFDACDEANGAADCPGMCVPK